MTNQVDRGASIQSIDRAAAILRLLASEVIDPVNIGNEEELSMLELAEAVRAAAGSQSAIEHRPLPEDDPRQRQPDITRAQELLGWEATIPLAEGLPPTIEWFRSQLT